jgi:ABC-type Na+ efflux pump permease subunit
MTETNGSSKRGNAQSTGDATWRPITVGRLASKELRETLRDRRTIITLFLMPLLVYPILSLLFQGFLASSFRDSKPGDSTKLVSPSASDRTEGAASGAAATGANPSQSTDIDSAQPASIGEIRYLYLFQNQAELDQVEPLLNRGFVKRQLLSPAAGTGGDPDTTAIKYSFGKQHDLRYVPADSKQPLQELVSSGVADVGVIVKFPEEQDPNQRSLTFDLTYRDDNIASVQAVRLLESILDALNVDAMQRLASNNDLRLPVPVRFDSVSVSKPVKNSAISVAALIPLVLTLMTITGAVYPAIDLTAGERERGTLESLIAAPIPRLRILLGKLIAIVAVAMLTAVLNLVGMMITIWVFRFDTVLFGEQGLTIVQVLKILALLVLFAGFFASVLLVISSFARSFKEGQAYLVPVMMVALAPGLMSLKPDLELTGIWAVTPLVNIVLLSRDILQGTARFSTGIIAIVSTVFYAAMAITMAARFFGTAKVLYGQDEGIGALFHRPRQSTPAASASLAMLCLALLFPASFLWQGLLTRFQDRSTEFLIVLAASGVIVVFVVIPVALVIFHRVHIRSGFNLNRTSFRCYLAAILLGLGLGPLLMQAIASSGQWLEYLNSDSESGAALLRHAEEQAERLRATPWVLVMLCFAITPAICEELFFRGLLFRSFRGALNPWATIFVTGLLFGAFHLITASGIGISRLFPTTLMGFALGWLSYKSGSVLPGMILHGLNNTLGLSLAYFRDEMVARSWITKDQNYIPLEILAVALIFTYTGFAILYLRRGVIRNGGDPPNFPAAGKNW